MTERTVAVGLAVLLVAISLVLMAAAHERHYKNRKWQMLEGRVNILEQIISGEHG